ncbi:MAG: NADH-quinone oxidoreductase subunit J, partial [Cyclobacteriaceae bacterium]|nr:NADH-quinone oxidoreductase subunit J [Cyclobacteriaceae bacterium]
ARMDHKLEAVGSLKSIASILLLLSGLGVVLWAILGYSFVPNGMAEGAHDVRAVGLSLLSYGNYGYVLPFEVISVLLLASMIGAIMIAKRYRK